MMSFPCHCPNAFRPEPLRYGLFRSASVIQANILSANTSWPSFATSGSICSLNSAGRNTIQGCVVDKWHPRRIVQASSVVSKPTWSILGKGVTVAVIRTHTKH
ncbi:hypothetical protein A0O28_0110110 [Trichoderma guizhouense]|uniref:Uncharacterized protein n=1 Tax=Trichoderma guizhouense TaxID=1491466 RepID=A0A1T3C5D1_9HYPO|nr:hypothetical protein A0O28_0110110 [Trichoderma guizhouense]